MIARNLMKLLQKFFKNNEKLNANEIAICTDSTNGKYKILDAYLDNINNYSTEEIIIGKWVDGKPLYRKVLTSSTFPSNGRFQSGLKNINEIISFETLIKSNNEWRHLPWLWAEGTSYGAATYCGGVFYQESSSDIFFQVGNSIQNNFQKFIVTIEYTKTVD